MSSFINSAKHFSTIKLNLYRYIVTHQEKIYLPYEMADRYRKIYDDQGFFEVREKAIFEQVDNFIKLQCLCVNLQYKHHSKNLDLDIELTTKEALKNVESERVSKTQLTKLIGCALYQVETEHLKELRELTKEEEDALYFFKLMQKELTEDILYNSEEFKNADYCI